MFRGRTLHFAFFTKKKKIRVRRKEEIRKRIRRLLLRNPPHLNLPLIILTGSPRRLDKRDEVSRVASYPGIFQKEKNPRITYRATQSIIMENDTQLRCDKQFFLHLIDKTPTKDLSE